MGTYQSTTNQGYQKPHPSNTLGEDVDRLRSALDGIDTDMAARAPLASPALTGTPTAPTAAANTNTTQIATTAFVRSEVNALIANAPGALNTLDELAAALGDDANFATTVTTALGNRYTKTESDARYAQATAQVEQVFTATAGQTAFTLTTAAPTTASILVSVEGVIQATTDYSLSQDGLTVTLSEAPGAGAKVRVLVLGFAGATTGTPSDDTVTTVKLRNGAVTTAKLADGAVTAAKLAPDAKGVSLGLAIALG